MTTVDASPSGAPPSRLARPGGEAAVLGVDACRGGWVGVRLDRDARGRLTLSTHFGATIAELVDAAGTGAGTGPGPGADSGAGVASEAVPEDSAARDVRPGALAIVAIDIPIGLPDDGARLADRLAAAALGSRRSSLFPTPVRAAIAEADYPAASALQRGRAGVGLSKQSHALRTKILDVDAWVAHRPTGSPEVLESHPELAFARLADGPLAGSKKTWNGIAERRRLLVGAGITLPDDAGEAGRRAAPDDLVDAAVLSLVALRRVDGTARPLPDEPERFSDGWPAAIWA
ncbi:hypothetical protein GCM10025865_16050 [Paraoerskovia sediminicola]|uniref:DUF429 domain-containing protein n=1 Tax=Paraoerskovia sediminicola TaxID=1138587 RepID=A0ABM8G2S1_9CELL|nr:DUF429 domain-containing protein [Paraoerskovia sediminicola]BDZ42306.1 hypothetical protein GCM10025865_16050 [Paraoerskovia sediminicola]